MKNCLSSWEVIILVPKSKFEQIIQLKKEKAIDQKTNQHIKSE